MDLKHDYLLFNHSERVTSVFLEIIRDEKPARVAKVFQDGEICGFFKGLAQFFYAINPSETSFKDHREVPSYFTNVSYN